jgi:hypothetical protein
MRRQRPGRFAVAAAALVLALSAAAGRSLIGQAAGGPKAPGVRTETAVTKGPHPSAEEHALLARRAEAQAGQMEQGGAVQRHVTSGPMALRVDGRLVAISGRARVFDGDPGNLFVWLVRVYADDGARKRRLLKEQHYVDRPAVLPPGETVMHPTFDDIVDLSDLKPGAYQVELSLYGVPPDFPFARVKFGEDLHRKTHGWVGRSQKVTLAE